MKRKFVSLAALTIISALLSTVAGAAPPAKGNTTTPKKSLPPPTFMRSASNEAAPLIHVKVNGNEVNFTSGEPVEAAGAILVPMRDIFEKLGANVAYDNASRTVRAVRGETTITLRPGDESAQVNGETTPLMTPAQIVNGAVVVPLRFISETMGAQVKWNPDSYAVTVNTDALVAQQLPTMPGEDAVTGMVTGLYPEADLLTVRIAGGENVRVPLIPNTNATRKTLGSNIPIHTDSETLPVFAAGAIRLGEQISIERDEEGNGILVFVNTDLRRGELKSIDPTPTNGGHQITLTDGTIVNLASNALVVFGNRPVPLDSLKPGDKVAIRLNDEGDGLALAVLTPAAPNVVPPLPPADTTTVPMPPIAPPQASTVGHP